MKAMNRPGRCNGNNNDTMSWRPDDGADEVAVVHEITYLSDVDCYGNKK